jgi:hypothetical protein
MQNLKCKEPPIFLQAGWFPWPPPGTYSAITSRTFFFIAREIDDMASISTSPQISKACLLGALARWHPAMQNPFGYMINTTSNPLMYPKATQTGQDSYLVAGYFQKANEGIRHT